MEKEKERRGLKERGGWREIKKEDDLKREGWRKRKKEEALKRERFEKDKEREQYSKTSFLVQIKFITEH